MANKVDDSFAIGKRKIEPTSSYLVKDRGGKRRISLEIERSISEFEIADFLAKHTDFVSLEAYLLGVIGELVDDYLNKARGALSKKSGFSAKNKTDEGSSSLSGEEA
jgi:hypothetical protein